MSGRESMGDGDPAGPVNESVQSLVVDGVTRRFLCVTPTTTGNGSLVIMLHGTAQRGALTRRITGWDAVVESEGATLLYPDAVGGYWRDGLRPDDAVNDVNFIERLVRHALDTLPVAPERIFLAGVSNGGFMAQRMAGERSPLFRGVASVIANLGASVSWPRMPWEPTSLCLIAGSEDPIVPYAGGRMLLRQANGLPAGEARVLSFEASVAVWADAGGFEPVARVEQPLDAPMCVVTADYWSPASGQRMRVHSLLGAGHHWFGYPIDPGYYATFGRSTQRFSATEAIWAFFKGLLS